VEPFFVEEVHAEQQESGEVQVAWEPPAETPPEEVGGYLVWRSASPFVLIAQINGTDVTNYTDTSAELGKTYRYTVTFFLKTGAGLAEALNGIAGLPADAVLSKAATIAGTSSLPEDGGRSHGASYLPIIIAVIGILAFAALVAIVLASRQRDEVHTVSMPTPATRRAVRCSACGKAVTGDGATAPGNECPHCGAVGALEDARGPR
jgi:hypothetical protein